MVYGIKLAAVSLGTCLTLAACGTNQPKAEPKSLIQTSALLSYDSCTALLDELNGLALTQVGPYGFGNDFGFPFPEPAFEGNEEAQFAESSADSSVRRQDGQVSSFTGTNNQEFAVDEADSIKTNGKIIALIQNEKLFVIDADTNSVRYEVNLPDGSYDGELFITKNEILVITQKSNDWVGIPEIGGPITSTFFDSSATRLVSVDIESGEISGTYDLAGNYLSARLVDNTIRVVLSNPAPSLDFVYPSSDSERAKEAAAKVNRDLISDLTIDDWLPVDENGNRVVECDALYVPENFAGFGFVNVVTLDDNLKISDATAVLTSAQDVYASTQRLIVTTPEWSEPGILERAFNFEADYETALHSFDISNPSRTLYVASGKVSGTLLNRYSMSEHDGFLRVATTEGSPWGRNSTENMVTVLAEKGDELEIVGKVNDIAKGESITAVRFFGEIGYVVTFEQIDPFFTIDLSDPKDPRVLGELKIPGFSSYLHPLDENRVFAVGTDGTDEGANGKVAASLFDVSDLSNPKLVDKLVLTQAWGATTVAQDPRAFQIWDETALIPVSDQLRTTYETRLSLVEINDNKLSLAGELKHEGKEICEVYSEGPYPVRPFESETPDSDTLTRQAPAGDLPVANEQTTEPFRGCYSYQPEITRSLVIDGKIYSLSEAGILVSDFEKLNTIAWIDI